jgi:hypothetical protein
MELITNFGAAVIALLLSLPALAYKKLQQALEWTPPGLIGREAGVVVVTYLSDFTNVNTTTPPTGAQASNLPCQVAQVFFADTDTQAIVIHNWGILLGQSFATFGWPIVMYPINISQVAMADSFTTNFTFGLANSNQVYINKPVGAGTGGTYLVYMFLPSSFMARAR